MHNQIRISTLHINTETKNHLLSFYLRFVFPTDKTRSPKTGATSTSRKNEKNQTLDTCLPKAVRMHIISYIISITLSDATYTPRRRRVQRPPPYTTWPCAFANSENEPLQRPHGLSLARASYRLKVAPQQKEKTQMAGFPSNIFVTGENPIGTQNVTKSVNSIVFILRMSAHPEALSHPPKIDARLQ